MLYNIRDLEKDSIEKKKKDGSVKTNAEMSLEARSKLANGTFQAGFRRAMVQFQTICVKNPGFYQKAAAIDVATDLVIIEHERGETAPASGWFEHSTPRMHLHSIRQRMSHFRRVAVHYKKSHTYASERGPFQCYCPAAAQLQCYQYKACPVEQACFLDCFENLEEFYYVVEVSGKREMPWYAAYRDHAKQQNYKLRTSKDPSSPPFELAHFYDTKKEYLQQCPKGYLKFLPTRLRTGKLVKSFATIGNCLLLDAMAKPRDCLVKVMGTYRSMLGSETFRNSLEQRKKVKFGILLAYNLNE
ncbi:hypothetical protein Daus18300_006554 [Diaporthe australafricana]|uniref:Uncharacterized protein n=1 Tax=Diaporthe australafricana TaxID=127596 RepID=A0ABR3WT51_9PEZI